MADSFEIEIKRKKLVITPNQQIRRRFYGKDGYFGVLAGHAALLSELGVGTLTITAGSKTDKFNLTGGYVEVRENHVRVLADKVD